MFLKVNESSSVLIYISDACSDEFMKSKQKFDLLWIEKTKEHSC